MPLSRDHARRRAAIVLDVDGTLVDSNDAHARAWVEAFAEAGVGVEYEQVRRAIGMGGDKLMPHVSGISEQSPEGTRISERRGQIFTSCYLPDIRPFPRVRELVQRFLDSGYTVVVASSAKEDELGALLERAGVRDLIDSQTSSDDAEHSKPDPDIVRAAVSRSGASPGAAIMIGDTPYDVEAARRSGVRIVGVESGGWRRQDLDGAEEVYGSPSDLWERYDESIFAQMSPDRARDAGDEGAPPSIDMNLVALIAAGVAGLALLALAIRAIARKRSGLPDGDEPVAVERAGLSPRDRERLRHLIERTS